MKEYIVLTISGETLFFYFKTINDEESKHVNSLEFYNASLFLTLKYYKKNYYKVLELFKGKNINTLTIKRLITFKYSMYLLNELKIENLKLDFQLF